MARFTDFNDWFELFGKSVLDPDVSEALRIAGQEGNPVIERDESETSVDIAEISVGFCRPGFVGRSPELAEGVGIVYSIAMHIGDPGETGYRGSLPFNVANQESMQSLRSKLGEPVDFDEDFAIDEWLIEGLNVSAMYTEDFNHMTSLVVKLDRDA